MRLFDCAESSRMRLTDESFTPIQTPVRDQAFPATPEKRPVFCGQKRLRMDSLALSEDSF